MNELQSTKTVKPKVQRYSLNLSPKYAPNWSAWEVAREVICNAMDAAPNSYKINAPSDNELTIWTPTVPDLSELFVIGHGSKCPGGTTIGQFGEGMKMAALVATRHPEGSIELRLPGQVVKFFIKEVLGTDVLHAEVSKGKDSQGYTVSIAMPGIGVALDGKILDNKTNGPIPKHKSDEISIYCKGIYVGSIKSPSVWDWNLNGLTINRDRSMVDPTSVKCSMASWMECSATHDQLCEIIGNEKCYEAEHGVEYTYSSSFSQKLGKAFESTYGDMAVLAEGTDHHEVALAENKGYKPVNLSDAIRAKIRYIVKTPASVLAESQDLEMIEPDAYMKAKLNWLKRIDGTVGAPAFGIRIFANRGESFKGQARYADNEMWLSSQLFTTGNDQELVRTYIHEMAHLMSNGSDATLEFEHALEGIAGRLAIEQLGSMMSGIGGLE